MPYRKKLIEVALPLEAINEASAREKSIRFGHPSTLHLWWARRPLAAARAVIFSQMVDDPSEYIDELLADSAKRREAERTYRGKLKAWEERKVVFDKAFFAGMSSASNPEPGPQPNLEETAAEIERQRLFHIIESMVQWENTTNGTVLKSARDEIWHSWQRTCVENANDPNRTELFDPKILPAFHDPFAGGGTLPLEAQRLGLESFASDLNPVAVLINKAMIEIPPKFSGRPPVNPEANKKKRLMDQKWIGVHGLVEDIRFYGQWLRNETEKRVGYLYPKVEVTTDMVKDRPDLRKYLGQKLTVIAWLWARTVKSPNPAFSHVDVPLASTFILSTNGSKQVYVEPIIEGNEYRFIVRIGKPIDIETVKNGTKLARGANFQCLMSGTPMDQNHIRGEFKAKRAGIRLMAIVAEGNHERIYLSPTTDHEEIAKRAKPAWQPDQEMNQETSNLVSGRGYGITNWYEIFTPRQLTTLTTYTDLVNETRERVLHDSLATKLYDEGIRLVSGGSDAAAYADAVAVYLGLAIDKITDYNSSLVLWSPTRDQAKTTFSRQALPMAWDFAETNLFAGAAGDIAVSLEGISRALLQFGADSSGHAVTNAAQTQSISHNKVVSTDPPYYDNIAYADLSDFFYIWLRCSLKPIFPDLFTTLAVPKVEELVATPYRHNGKEGAEKFFLEGMTLALHRLSELAHPAFPVSIYYAFRQSETDGGGGGTTSTGWDTFLEAVIRAGFALTGTWPIRTERSSRSIGIEANALASSIVLVCRKISVDAPTVTRREFIIALKNELPLALALLQRGNIAPVDLAQAAIGPGMAIYTRYSRVLDAQGKPLSVRQALALINQTLDDVLAEQEGDFDADTRWALAWFEQMGFLEGEFGVADVLARAKDTSVEGMVEAGILSSGRGKVRLLRPSELNEDWNPNTDKRLTAWEMVHQLVRELEANGENGASIIMSKLGAKAEMARELCYRLYALCERKKRSSDALSYNALVQSWPEIIRLARENAQSQPRQESLF